MTKRTIALIGSLLVACTSPQKTPVAQTEPSSPSREPSEAPRMYTIYGHQVALHNSEHVPSDEPAAINSLNEIMMGLFKKEYGNQPTKDPVTGTEFKGTRRGVHPRGHACVVGKLKVDTNLQNSVGIFKPGAQYDVTMRFSNGSPIP